MTRTAEDTELKYTILLHHEDGSGVITAQRTFSDFNKMFSTLRFLAEQKRITTIIPDHGTRKIQR